MADASARDPGRLTRYDALVSISKTLAGHKTVAELFQVLAHHLHSVVPFDALALILHDEQTDEMRLVVLEPTDIVPPFLTRPVADQGPAATVWETQKGAVVTIPDEGPVAPALAYIHSLGQKLACLLPLTTARHKLGVLAFGSRSASAYSDDVLAFMEQIAAVVAVAVENKRNYDEAQGYQRELREQRDQLQFLLDVNNFLVSRLDRPALLKAIFETVQRVVPADHVSVAFCNRESSSLQFGSSFDVSRGFINSDATLPLDGTMADATLARGAPMAFRLSGVDAGRLDAAVLMKDYRLESVCCVPLVTGNGQTGALYVGRATTVAFSQDDAALLGQTSAQIAIAAENTRAFEELARVNARLADEKHYLERELDQQFPEIIGRSRALRHTLTTVRTVAPTDSSVLILGETGTGKELIARAIHNLGARSARPFIRMNAAALPVSLLESELFGHEKGAFTGATESRTGRLELAHRGTLFLDEIGDVPLEVQPKLLRVLQEREFERLGSARTQRVDVRFVAATNRDLARMVEDGSFRSDLYYRLNVFPITVPPLRERAEDIPALALHFVTQCARRLGRPVPSVSPAVMDVLARWTWPGNIRELQNVIERGVIQSTGSDFVLPLQDVQPKAPARPLGSKQAATLQEAEREAIVRALRESGGVIAGPAGAAARLGLQRTTLQGKMRRLGIRRPSY
jgi:formate hydrogenlyase transcriptional activator